MSMGTRFCSPLVIIALLCAPGFGEPGPPESKDGKPVTTDRSQVVLNDGRERIEMPRDEQGRALVSQLGEDCRKGRFDFGALLAKIKANPAANNPLTLSGASYMPYMVCSASAARPKFTCEDVKLMDNAMSRRYDSCREQRALIAAVWAALRNKEFSAPCRAFLTAIRPNHLLPPSALARMCGAMASSFRSGDAAALCGEFEARGWVRSKKGSSCGDKWAWMSRDKDRCPDCTSQDAREDHAQLAAFYSAARSADPGACRASPLCDVLTRGDAAACSPLLARADKSFCGFLAPQADGARGAMAEKQALQKKMFDEGVAKHQAPAKAAAEAKYKEGQAALREKAKQQQAEDKRKLAEAEQKARQEAKLKQEEKSQEEVRKAKEIAAKKLELEGRVRQAVEERKKKKQQFKQGEAMQQVPAGVDEQMEKIDRRGQ